MHHLIRHVAEMPRTLSSTRPVLSWLLPIGAAILGLLMLGLAARDGSQLFVGLGVALLGGSLTMLGLRLWRIEKNLSRVSTFVQELPLRSDARLDATTIPATLAPLASALNNTASSLAAQLQAAHAGELRGRTMLESALDCIVSVDNGGHITEFNPAAEKTFGYRRDEVIGRDMSTLLVPLPLMSQHIEAMQAYQEGQATAILGHRRAITARRRDGSEFPADIVVVASNISGRREFSVWLRDLTETRQAADAMLKARIAAEDANRAKSDFLANMSHEIRTPLNAVIGITELALDTDLSREQRDYLNLVRSSGDALLNIINELLDYAKIEAGHLDFEHIEFGLRHTVAMAVRSLAPKANEQRLELLINIGRDVPDALIGDPHRIRQILTNLIGNAIKFTPKGEIEVQVSRLPVREDGSVMLQFNVRDTGIGIPRDKLGTIFDAFTQVDTSTTRKFGGTGLGLAICTRLVEAMGGRIWADSEPGRGSVFRFSARFDVNATTAAPP
ncbi:MAG TPA: ATP-binding protein, partial [Rhodocyclaceae bacterium]|nr:ATP-binding protein [Rhodocyclaceae bacterium]